MVCPLKASLRCRPGFAKLAGSEGRPLFFEQVIIDNHSGAGGMVGTELAARAPADGYTVALGFLGTFAIGPHVYSRVPYDPIRDFTPGAMR